MSTRCTPCTTVLEMGIHYRVLEDQENPDFLGGRLVAVTICNRIVRRDIRSGTPGYVCRVCVEIALGLGDRDSVPLPTPTDGFVVAS